MGVLLVIGGRLGDRYGRRRLFLIGMTGFTLASAICGLAPTPVVLIIARVVHGAFGALMIPQGMAVIARHFTPELRRTAFNLFGPLLGIATITGPVLAGFVIEADIAGLSWRPIFLVNLVLGTAGIALAARMGACFGTLFDITIGDVDPAEAGSASGTLTAVQQLTTALGSATVTTVYLHGGAPDHAMLLAIIAVMAVTALCLPLLLLLPKSAPTSNAG